MAKMKEQPPEEGSPAWMATFSDLMNLLLCFFVLLFASSSVDEEKIQKIAASFDNITFDVMDQASESLLQQDDLLSGGVTQVPDIESMLTEPGKNVEGTNGPEVVATKTDATNLSDHELEQEYDKRGEKQSEELYDEISEMIETNRIEDKVEIDFTSEYVELDLSGSILFDSGSEVIRDDAKLFLQKIATILIKYKNCVIEIEGHTDNVPVGNSKYKSNRDLSAARARSVYDYIMTQENFIDANMKITGFGESRPVASNATEEGRLRNRRVAIKIYNQQNSDQ